MQDLCSRTLQYALTIIDVCAGLHAEEPGRTIGRQLLHSGTSVGAHYREASRARSRAEFASKLNAGLMELEETHYWLEILEAKGLSPSGVLHPLMQETSELIAIFVTMIKKAKPKKD